MILQKIQFPNDEVCNENIMFFRTEDSVIYSNEKYCELCAKDSLTTDTYFNSFSICKWMKYTKLNNLQLRLSLKGNMLVSVQQVHKMQKRVEINKLVEKHFNLDSKQDVLIDIPLNDVQGIFYFEIFAIDDGAKLFGGSYETKVDEEKLPKVKIAIDICTFRREKYVTKNIDILNSEIINNTDSPLYGNLEVFISDNGKTLNCDKLNSGNVHVFPNKNLGGAGGFTRSMIEIKKVSDQKGITHILMMDDDIKLNPDSLFRTYVMLRMLKDSYKDAFIGGHMLKLDRPSVQSEAADHWDIVTHHPVKYLYDLQNIDYIVKNEVEDTVNYFGWWYCCMPIDVVNDENLPLPIFIKRDDIEYGLRNGKTFITENGICVWHEAFEYKYSTYLEYYYFRNMCIVNSRHRLSFNADRLISELRKRVLKFVIQYRYKDAELSMLGILHFLKGVDWFKSQDGEKLNKEIMKHGYKKVPLDKLDFVFIHGNYENNVFPDKESRREKLKRLITANGWLLPAHNSVAVPVYQPCTQLFYRAKRVLNYEESTNTGFITNRDYHSAYIIYKMYRETVKAIKKNFKRVSQEYRDRYDELINIDFWNKYLFTSSEVDSIESRLDKKKKPKNTKNQFRELTVSYLLRFVQLLLFWLPRKKNRVMVYVHDRKGFTCNPKYIVKKLKELYGDKLEIIWSTMHPDTCDELRDMGIQVVKNNTSKQFKLYLRTRFFITNDAFPSWATHGLGQKWMNTWHAGMNYKHIGYDYLAPMSPMANKIFKIKNRTPDFYLSGSQFFTDDTSKSFRYNKKIFVSTGLPRNDVFFHKNDDIDDKIRNLYHIDKDVKLAIYAPTFRRGFNENSFEMDFERVKEALESRFGGKWQILFRNHIFVKGKQKFPGTIDVSGYCDMQDLMAVSDVLISDYSSCLYDFCMSSKPAFVYATDLEYYKNSDRSFAYPLEKWPYPISKNNNELVDNIINFDEQDYRKRVAEHLKDACAFDDGNASEKACKIISKYCLRKKYR